MFYLFWHSAANILFNSKLLSEGCRMTENIVWNQKIHFCVGYLWFSSQKYLEFSETLLSSNSSPTLEENNSWFMSYLGEKKKKKLQSSILGGDLHSAQNYSVSVRKRRGWHLESFLCKDFLGRFLPRCLIPLPPSFWVRKYCFLHFFDHPE